MELKVVPIPGIAAGDVKYRVQLGTVSFLTSDL